MRERQSWMQKDQLFWVFSFQFQSAGMSDPWTPNTAAELFAVLGSRDTRAFTWRKVDPTRAERAFLHPRRTTLTLQRKKPVDQ